MVKIVLLSLVGIGGAACIALHICSGVIGKAIDNAMRGEW